MTAPTLITTPTWTIALPPDWTELKDQDSGMHFESADGSRALYIATWTMAPGNARPARALADDFVAHDLAQLAAMEDHAWDTLEQRIEDSGEACLALIDSYEQNEHYRIISRILARSGQVVRATFHDYECEDLAQSGAVFAPMVASLRLVPR